MAKFFIYRPVFAIVTAIVLTLCGIIAGISLPIAQYPQITLPTIRVSAVYPGASAEVVEQAIAQPIEEQVNGVEGMLYMSSSSSGNGGYNLDITFGLENNADIAAVQVQNRSSQANARLPSEAISAGITTKKQTPDVLMYLALVSPNGTYDELFLANYATINVVEAIKRIKGVGNVSLFGAEFGMRLWLRPDRMASLGVTPSDIYRAIQEQNAQAPAGQVGQMPAPKTQQFQYGVEVRGRLSEVSEFEEIIVRAKPDGSFVRVRDVARVELGAKDYVFQSRLNGQPAAAFSINLTPDASALETAGLINAELKSLATSFPADLSYDVVLDNTVFVKASLNEVVHTFFEALLLVLVVVFLFLQNWRATVIPMLAVPVSLVGTFAAFTLLGFTINTLTLFGMVLAIGIVVDDAIVVVENVETHMTRDGLGPLEASMKAMSEIAGALISIVLVLVAVFLPVAFLGGVTGTLYQQFAITIAISVVLSGVMALTLSPALAAIIIKAHHGEKKGFFRWFERGFARLTDGYVGGVARAVQAWPLSIGLFLAVLVGIVLMFRTLPSSFVPDEDQGYFFVVVEAPDTASLGVVSDLAKKVEAIVAADPAVQDVATVAGYSLLDGSIRNNAAVLFVSMKPFGERKTPDLLSFAALPRINARLAGLTEGFALAVNPPPIPGLGTTGGFEFYLQNRGAGDVRATNAALQAFLKAARERPELAGISTTFRGSTQQLFVDLDRAKAEVLGVPVQDAFQTMQAFFGSQVAGQFSQFSRVWWVVLQADAQYRVDPRDFDGVYVRSREGKMVPLSGLIRLRYVAAPKLLERFNGFPAVKISGNPAAGYSSGQALAAMEDVARKTLPADFSYSWAGQALQEKASGSTSAIAFVAGLIVVFLLLAAQFEKWTLPLAVLLTVPVAILGALLLTWALGLENDVYFQVGLVTLVGLSAKNAILICEVAIEHVRAGMAVKEAALLAARARLRAIVMTSLAFGLGCVPLATASGPGANSLRAIGTGVIGGIVASTLVAVFFAPFFFWLLESLSQRFGGKPPPPPAAPAAQES